MRKRCSDNGKVSMKHQAECSHGCLDNAQSSFMSFLNSPMTDMNSGSFFRLVQIKVPTTNDGIRD